ncbi:ABC transporter ATP-binding protein [Clostridium oceanicum]|uniref:ABC transporter ATP-binding protein n=1 Tax=Clostridium oceanicum TaxID=1543 RepID=A0ABP3UR29_9CLOT
MDSKKEKKSSLSELLKFAGNSKGKINLSIFLAIIGVLLVMLSYLSVAMLAAGFFDNSITKEGVLKWSLVALGGFIGKMLFTTLSTMTSHEAAFTILKNIRSMLSEKMLRVPLGVMMESSTGELKTLVVDTVEKLEKPLAHILPEMTSNLLTPIFIIIILFVLDWRMALAGIATIPLGFIVMMGQMIGYKENSSKFMKAGSDMNEALIEYVNGIEVIKAFNQSSNSYERFTKAVLHFRNFTLGWWRKCWGFAAAGYALVPSTLLVSLPFGSMLFMKGSIDFSTFITCIILSMGIAGPLLAAFQFFEDFAVVYQSIEEVDKFLHIKELKRPSERVVLDKDAFRLEHVSFSYGDNKVLDDVSLNVLPKKVTAIVGPSGGGKSTIMKLMAGFWDVNEGSLLYGNKDIRNIPTIQLMEEISYVAQDNFLFDCSIKENIRFGNANATDEEVINAAKSACCHDFIMNLSKGYDTKVGDAGGKLSGGERQRITLARAILKNSNVILLDEATAFADPENEDLIQEALARLIKGKTLVVIAHRLTTIQDADQIVVVENGKIVDKGSQRELLSRCNLYKNMWDKHMAVSAL